MALALIRDTDWLAAMMPQWKTFICFGGALAMVAPPLLLIGIK